jgi:hypothetical protein
MEIAETAFEQRVRRAYEFGRVLLGVRRAALVAPMAALSLVACERPGPTWLAASLLAAVVVLFEWRGQAFARGARVGLVAGLPPLLLPLIVRATLHVCNATFCLPYSTVCLGAGVVGGGFMGLSAVRRGVHGSGVAAAALVASLAGSLGCLVAGLGGVVGLVAGLGLGAAPLIALRRT